MYGLLLLTIKKKRLILVKNKPWLATNLTFINDSDNLNVDIQVLIKEAVYVGENASIILRELISGFNPAVLDNIVN
jgi:hypothetical protein